MVLDVASVVGPDGWTTWEALTARVDRKTVVRWTAAGTLVRLQPGIYAMPAAAAQWRMRVEAAVLSRGGVASHRTALALWGLVAPGGPVHVTVEPHPQQPALGGRGAAPRPRTAGRRPERGRRPGDLRGADARRHLGPSGEPADARRPGRCDHGGAPPDVQAAGPLHRARPPSAAAGPGVAGRARPAARRGLPERAGDLGLPERAPGAGDAALLTAAPGRGERPDVLSGRRLRGGATRGRDGRRRLARIA